MSNFKVGDKVIVTECCEPRMRFPEINKEIVIIKSRSYEYSDAWILEGYEYANCGTKQHFHSDTLRKVDEIFAEKPLQNSMNGSKRFMNLKN